MQEFKREQYLNELIASKENRLIKVITGIRRSGKSYLLDPIFKNYLITSGVKENHIIKLDLDLIENHNYRDPMELFNYVMDKVKDKGMYYILLDEIQSNIYKTYLSTENKDISLNTITSYIEYLENAFLIKKVQRYDVKGRKYITTPFKYYFTDLGLRNIKLNFRQQEENHIMENIIYNELLLRGYNVDVGVVESRNKNNRIFYEIDFICNMASNRYYIQSALSIDEPEKNIQKSRSLNYVKDNFKKIIVVKDNINAWHNENGILIIGIIEFLLNSNSLEL